MVRVQGQTGYASSTTYVRPTSEEDVAYKKAFEVGMLPPESY